MRPNLNAHILGLCPKKKKKTQNDMVLFEQFPFDVHRIVWVSFDIILELIWNSLVWFGFERKIRETRFSVLDKRKIKYHTNELHVKHIHSGKKQFEEKEIGR